MWLKQADAVKPETGIPTKPVTPKGPAVKSPFTPVKPEEKEVVTAEKIAKDLKSLIATEMKEGEAEEVALLEDALKKVEKFIKAEVKEEKENKEPKSEASY